ncbi:MAG TPA: sulfite exporter TauE/SafE family protein [Polyangiales bacterium]|nr:sulfite exporter TauE/SafE family protein [Polyangiales bacterium]
MFALALALAAIVGVSLGLLGGGGSILAVPILRYVLGLAAHQAIALSLLVVGTTSLAAVIPHALRDRVRWRTGIIFGLAAMGGAFLAGRLAHLIPAAVLLIGFALMMVATAVAMLRTPAPTTAAQSASRAELPVLKVLLEGSVVGAITGLVGAGGGFLVVPALVLLGGLPMELAVGTSLLVIAMKSFAAFAGFASTLAIDWTAGVSISAAAVVGSIGGSLLANRVHPKALRAAFGWFVVAMAIFILGQELPPLFGRTASPALAALAALLATSGGAGCRALWVRKRTRPQSPVAPKSEFRNPMSQAVAGGRVP